MASSRLWQQSLSQLRGQSTHVARRKYTPYEKPWTHDKFDEHQDGQARRHARPSRPASSHGIKVVLRQVHYEVAPDRIRSLLVGIAPLVKGPSIQYDAAGRPTGQVTAWFRNEADAQKVQQQLHGMTFNDQVLDVSVSLEPTTNSSLAARLAPLPSEARPKKPRRTKKSAPTSRPALSAADLDAELDAFMNTSSMTTEL